MRIVGGNDYYDRARKCGHDTHTTYVRGRTELAHAEAIAIGIYPSRLLGRLAAADGAAFRRIEARHGIFDPEIDFLTVIACGRRYQGIRIMASVIVRPETEFYLWTSAGFKAWLTDHSLEWEPAQSKAASAIREAPGTHGLRDIDAYFAPRPLARDVLGTVIERRWTILSHAPERWPLRPETPWKVDQPSLGQLEFFRSVQHDQMHQEIDMWVGGTLPSRTSATAEVSDHIRLAKHGMDHTSFRRAKGEKKPRRRKTRG